MKPECISGLSVTLDMVVNRMEMKKGEKAYIQPVLVYPISKTPLQNVSTFFTLK